MVKLVDYRVSLMYFRAESYIGHKFSITLGPGEIEYTNNISFILRGARWLS